MYVRPEKEYWFTRLPQKKRKHRNHPRLPRQMQSSDEEIPEQIGKIVAIDYKKKTVIVEWIKFTNNNIKTVRGPGEMNSKIKNNWTFSYSIGLRNQIEYHHFYPF